MAQDFIDAHRRQTYLVSRDLMSGHSFRVSHFLKVRLEAEGRKARQAERDHFIELVHKNDSLMKDGGFDTQDGRQGLPPVQTDRVRLLHAAPYKRSGPCRFEVTDVCVANCDTLTAALVVGDALALNFANAGTPGGGYRRGSSAQEEDLCRLLPQLYPSLQGSGHYPIGDNEALVTLGLAAVRRPFSYQLCPSLGTCSIVTAAMPNGVPPTRTEAWEKTVTLRIRTVLHAAKISAHTNLILGAFGCGAFGNPPDTVAALFKKQIVSPEFRGRFARIVFAIIDTKGRSNLTPFCREFNAMQRAESDAVAPPPPLAPPPPPPPARGRTGSHKLDGEQRSGGEKRKRRDETASDSADSPLAPPPPPPRGGPPPDFVVGDHVVAFNQQEDYATVVVKTEGHREKKEIGHLKNGTRVTIVALEGQNDLVILSPVGCGTVKKWNVRRDVPRAILAPQPMGVFRPTSATSESDTEGEEQRPSTNTRRTHDHEPKRVSETVSMAPSTNAPNRQFNVFGGTLCRREQDQAEPKRQPSRQPETQLDAALFEAKRRKRT